MFTKVKKYKIKQAEITFPLAQEVYCKSCYGKEYGPKGYGYGAGAGTLSMDAGTKGWATNTAPLNEGLNSHKYLGGNECGRCGGSVYSAEEVLGAGLVSIWFCNFFIEILFKPS